MQLQKFWILKHVKQVNIHSLLFYLACALISCGNYERHCNSPRLAGKGKLCHCCHAAKEFSHENMNSHELFFPFGELPSPSGCNYLCFSGKWSITLKTKNNNHPDLPPQTDIRYSLIVTWNNLNLIDFIIGLSVTHKAPLPLIAQLEIYKVNLKKIDFHISFPALLNQRKETQRASSWSAAAVKLSEAQRVRGLNIVNAC